jgi:hypothetical integral membrane protein (TIGR02206 family)
MREYTMFSLEHFIYIFGYGGLGVLVFFLPKILKYDDKKILKLAKISGYLILIDKFLELFYRHFVIGETIIDVLPFNMCNYTMILAAIMMITKSRKIFPLVYFWSIGAIFAIVTPDVFFAFPNPQNISFFITHFYIYFSIGYAIKYFGFSIDIKDYKKAFIYLNIIMFILFFLNLLIGSNYMFLRHVAPKSPMELLGPWPYYIISLEVVMVILFTAMYLPFRKRKK